jgi:hypothetical protein
LVESSKNVAGTSVDLCLIFSDTVSVFKVFNLKLHLTSEMKVIVPIFAYKNKESQGVRIEFERINNRVKSIFFWDMTLCRKRYSSKPPL